jgi:hypothetical protein
MVGFLLATYGIWLSDEEKEKKIIADFHVLGLKDLRKVFEVLLFKP